MANDKAQDLFKAALAAGAKRDYQKAIELLTRLLAEDEAPLEALLYLGRSYNALGEGGMAIEAIRQYLRRGGEAAAGYFFLGRAYLSSGLYPEASSALRKSLAADPHRASAWALLGATQLKLKRSKLAVECLERAVGLAPEDRRIFRGYLNALFVRALRLLSQGDAETASQAFGFIIEQGIDTTAIRLWRAKALRELGRYEEALRDCAVARRNAPGDPSIRWLEIGLLLASGRQREALAAFDELREAEPGLPDLPGDRSAFESLRLALAFKEGRWKEVLSESHGLLRRRPRDPAIHALVAESLRALGHLEGARNHWERAIEADPQTPDFRLGYALVLWDLGDYQGALAAAERARRLGGDSAEADYCALLCKTRLGEDPGKLIPSLQALLRSRAREGGGADPRLMFALGEALYRSERPDLATSWFKKVLLLVPDHELSLLYLISSAESLNDESAVSLAYAAYLAQYPDNGTIRKDYIEYLAARGAWESLAEVLEGGLSYGEPGTGMRRLLARSYREAGRWREAAIIYRELLRAEPANGELLLALALCLDRIGQSGYALALLQKAPAAAKKNAGSWIVMGMLSARRGRTEAALDALRKACELEPRNPRPWREIGQVYRKQGLKQFAEEALGRARTLEATAGRDSDAKGRDRKEPATELPRPERPARSSPEGKGPDSKR